MSAAAFVLRWLGNHVVGRERGPRQLYYLQRLGEPHRRAGIACILTWKWQLTTKIRHFYNVFIEVLMNK